MERVSTGKTHCRYEKHLEYGIAMKIALCHTLPELTTVYFHRGYLTHGLAAIYVHDARLEVTLVTLPTSSRMW
jgi:hypothetical protein